VCVSISARAEEREAIHEGGGGERGRSGEGGELSSSPGYRKVLLSPATAAAPRVSDMKALVVEAG
jgi:hypothetical protein